MTDKEVKLLYKKLGIERPRLIKKSYDFPDEWNETRILRFLLSQKPRKH